MARRLVALSICLIAVAHASAAGAQDTPVVFLHGLGSDSGTWNSAATNLQQQLAIEAYRTNTSWQDTYGAQGSQIQNTFGSLLGSTIAIGHSNGGIVSREWSKHRNLGGLVTLGTPHGGAPLLSNLLSFAHFDYALGNAISVLFNDFGYCATQYGCDWYYLLYRGGLDSYLLYLRAIADISPSTIAATLGITGAFPVLPQMVPGSSYLSDLNSSGNLTREASAVGTRVGIVSIAHNFNRAGYVRIKNPELADTVANWVDIAVFLLQTGSTLVTLNADPDDDLAWSTADTMLGVAGLLSSLDRVYCSAVSSYVGGDCYLNDTVVPVWSQLYPDSVAQIIVPDGPIHIQETTKSDATLYSVLTNFMNIGPRASGSGGSSGGSGGGGSTPMTSDAAVRGCANYVEWSPVYQPTPSACHDYCAANGANSCEWYSGDGSCYVEFGSSCYVQPGFGGWSAEVLSQGAPPSPPRPSGQDGLMHSNSAVRGCEVGWWDPVYQPSEDACRSYCLANNADACEWYDVNGDCYAEWGSGCHVENGYSNWSAAVFR